ncbi:MAG: hypothetical protein HDR02_17915 [Lachnospiraceae bacterium]|nr:hypothetical protein [Lachnospiraceae bacterium]
MLYFENGTFEKTYNDALFSLLNEDYLIGGDPQILYETNSIFQFDYTADAIKVVDNEFVVSYDYSEFMDDYETLVQKNIDYYTKYFLRNMQLQSVIMRLKNNRFSKQAILSLPKDITNHYPAEMYVSFRILNDMLHTIAHMRANNAYGETLVNMHIDCALANKVASALGIEHTTYTHVVDGYHVYHRDLTKVKNALFQCSNH